MTPEQIQKLADGLPPSCMGKDHEEVVAWLAKQHTALQQQVNALAAELERLKAQEPVGYTDQDELDKSVDDLYMATWKRPLGGQLNIPLFTCPIAAAPVKVPGAIEPDKVPEILDPTAHPDGYACCVGADMWNACRTEVLKINSESEDIIKSNNAKN